MLIFPSITEGLFSGKIHSPILKTFLLFFIGFDFFFLYLYFIIRVTSF